MERCPASRSNWTLTAVTSLEVLAGFGVAHEDAWEDFERWFAPLASLDDVTVVLAFFDSALKGFEEFESGWAMAVYLYELPLVQLVTCAFGDSAVEDCMTHDMLARLDIVGVTLDSGRPEVNARLGGHGPRGMAYHPLMWRVASRVRAAGGLLKINTVAHCKSDPARPEGKRFWEIEVRQGRLSRARLDLFVQHYLAMKLERDVRIGELFREYKVWIEGPPQPFSCVDDELAEFARYADQYRQLLRPADDPDLARLASRADALNISSAHPLVLWLTGERRISVAARNAMFRDIESFLVRRAVCARPSKSYTRRFLDVLRDFRKAGDLSPEAFHALLAAETKEVFGWPRNDEFEVAWNTVDAYKMLKPERVEMILRAVETASRSPKSEPSKLLGPLTMAHVMPQDWEKHWPLPAGVDPALAREQREEVVHDFGNLTLLTQALNSSVSHGPAASKLPAIMAQSNLELSKWFHGRTTWTEDDIRERGRALFGRAKSIWPGP